MQARFANRLTPADWQYLESCRDYGHCLDVISKTPAARYVAPLAKSGDAHGLEQALRDVWADMVSEIASWVPPGWQDAVCWMVFLPHLRFVESWHSGDPAPDWLVQDRVFGPLWASGGAAWDMAPLVPASPGEATVSDLWLQELENRMPGGIRFPAFRLEMDQLFSRYLVYDPGQGFPPVGGQDLADHLKGMFRKRTQAPVAVFAYLGLAALDMERLRAVLARRLAFPDMTSAMAPEMSL